MHALTASLAVVTTVVSLAPPAGDGVRLEARATHVEGREILVRAVLRRGAGRPVVGARVVARASMNTDGHEMELLPARLRHRGGGVYTAGMSLLMDGRWSIRVTAQIPNRPPLSTTFTVEIDADP